MSANGTTPGAKSGASSSQSQDGSNHHSGTVGRAVTDAVHERLIPNYVYCESCDIRFIGNLVSIHQHFNKSHPSHGTCIYCKESAFYYYKVKNANNKAEMFCYHKCPRN